MNTGHMILDLLLLALGALQGAALWLRLSGRTRIALGMTVVMPLIVVALYVICWNPKQPPEREWLAYLALHCFALVAAAIGIVVRRLSGWLFWPVWAAGFTVIAMVVYLRFFFHIF